MNRVIATVIASLLLCAAPVQAKKATQEAKQILGWLEYGIVYPGAARVTMKLDTGAKTSSMHAEDIEIFKRDGKKHVRFRFDTSYEDDEDFHYNLTIERPLVREVVIKRHKKKNQARPVVTMDICLGGRHHTGEFSLVDRTRFNYPVLLGRRLLGDIALVDPGSTFTGNTKACSEN